MNITGFTIKKKASLSVNTEGKITAAVAAEAQPAAITADSLLDKNADQLLELMSIQELYPVDNQSIELSAAYDTTNLVANTEITHVDDTLTLFNRHFDLFNDIRKKVHGNDDETDAETSMHRRLKQFIEKWKDDADVQGLLGGYYNRANNSITITRDSSPLVKTDVKLEKDENDGTKHVDNGSSALFKLSRYAMDDFHRMSNLRRNFTRLKRAKSIALKSSLKKRSLLNDQIEDAREAFENSEKNRLTSEENYALVRGLVEEQLQAVDDAFIERHRILSNPLGLCYVRVSDLPMQINFQQTPLIAEPGAGQLPAICKQTMEMPQRLQPFLDLLDDQPMSSWKLLKPYWRWLPESWVRQPPIRVIPQLQQSISLMPLPFHTLISALPVIQNRPIVSANVISLSSRSQMLADDITLEQLTKTRHAGLRQKARRLQDDLSSALSCLLQQLQDIPAAARYNWSRLAESDVLNTEKPLSWPQFYQFSSQPEGLYLREIIEWLYAQLDPHAMTESRSAMRTVIRACLLHAVNDDPQDLLQGKVIQFPGFINPGAMMTATLNRVPTLSAKLKVYDGAQHLIAEAQVVDSNETEASIEIISTYVTTPVAFASWTVVGHKALSDAGIN